VALLAGLVAAVACVFLAVLVSSHVAGVEEFGFAALLVGAIGGLTLGGFLAGRVIGPAVASSRGALKCVLVSPGLWLAVLLLSLSGIHNGLESEYFGELIAPAFLGAAIAAAASAWGASRSKSSHT